jgi:hypothetical protein
MSDKSSADPVLKVMFGNEAEEADAWEIMPEEGSVARMELKDGARAREISP